MRGKVLLLLSVVAALALSAPSVFAGSTGAVADNSAANSPPSSLPGYASDATSFPNTTCDTIDPTKTQSSTVLAYKCINAPPAPVGSGHTRIADLASATFETYDGPDPDTANDRIRLVWTSHGHIPTVGSTDVITGVSGFVFQFFFQVPKKQNARQIVGDTLDCARYAHMGPYLTGNGEYLNFNYEVIFNADSLSWEDNFLFAHLDPVANNNWAFVADDASAEATTCSGLVRGPAAGWSGTGVTAGVSPDGKTLTVTLPMRFCWADNQTNLLCYQIMSPSDQVTAIMAQTSATVDAATTPEVKLPPGCVAAACIVQQSPQGVSNQFLLDWSPWAAFDLGVHPSQGYAVPGPRCASFEALEYQPGGGKNATGGVYAPLGKGPSGQDRDTQVNPLYDAGTAGLSRYDSSGVPGNTTNDLVTQNHGGPTQCAVLLASAPHYTGVGGTITA